MKNKTLLMMLLCLFIFPIVSSSQTFYVNSTSNYTTIQGAINNASNGDSVVVSSGIYNEDLIINKSIILLGAQNGIDARTRTGSESIISSNDSLGTIKVGPTNGTVVIDGFNLISSPAPQGGAIYVSGLSEQVDIRNNIIEYSTADGILMYYAKKGTIEKNYIKGAQLSGITGGQNDGSPFLKSQLTINNNKIESSRYGITGYLDHSTISNNKIIGNALTPGAGIGGQFYNTLIELNNISGYTNGAGIAFQDYLSRGTSRVNVKNNLITNNGAGIFVNQTINGKFINISYNKIFDNSIGVVNTNTDYFEVLNAEYNYWKSCQGPPSGNISGYVDYEPWIGVCVKSQSISSDCLIENEPFILNAEILGNCISEVVFSVLKNGIWKNYSSSVHIGNNYSLNLENLSSSHFEWKAYTVDCLNNVNESLVKNFYIYPKTTLTISPLEPNGKNGWYITNPLFILTNPNASQIYYKWDSQKIFLNSNSTPFGFENAPNNQNKTGGVIDLHYWGNLSCNKNESNNYIILKSDLTNPKIEPIYPIKDALVDELRPKISVHLDEIYGGNSGVNVSSIILTLNGAIVNPNITINNLDANAEYTPNLDLPEVKNNLSIHVEDNAGRLSEKSWSFNVKFVNKSFNLNVNSPNLMIYGISKISFNITTDKKVNLIEYKDSGSNGRWIKLCTNCNNYGNSSKKTKTFSEGQHNITIRASNEFEAHEKNVSFIVDSKIPKIYKTEPRSNQFTDGSNFYIRFSEENPLELFLFINNSLNKYKINLSNCAREGAYTACYYDVNLTSFEGQTIPYWFELKDIANHTSLIKKTLIKVDTKYPYINILYPKEDANYTRRVPFSIFVNETNLDSITYTYTYNGREKTILLCTTLNNNYCNKTKTFSPGNYSITIKAEDKGGKVIGIPVEFEVK